MSDLGLTWNASAFAADLSIVDNDFAPDDGLETAVLLSLFTDRRAEPTDVLPSEVSDRRGWWADAVPVVDGDRFGSRLWLLGRAKADAQTLQRAEDYAREALQWLLDDRVASAISVSASALTPVNGYELKVTIERPQGDPVTFHFGRAWDAQAQRI